MHASQKNITTLFLFFFFLILLFPGKVIAQKDFRPGYIITNSGDTIYGLIDYRGDSRNAQRCVFRKNEDAPEQIFNPFDIKAFRFINDGKYYISKTITLNNKEKAVFLEFLLEGITNVYYYRDLNNHYFIERESEGRLYELSNNDLIINEGNRQYIRESKKYIGIMRMIYQDCPSLFPEINKAEFNDKSLIHIAEAYHNKMCEGEKCIIYEKEVPGIRIRIGAYAGYRMKFLRFHVAGQPFYSSLDYTPGSSAVPGVTFALSLPRVNERISLVINTDFSRASFHAELFEESPLGTSKDYYEVNTRYSALNLSILNTYTFPLKRIRPMISAGISFDITTGQNTEIIRETESQNIITTYYSVTDPVGRFSLGPVVEGGIIKSIFKIPVFFQVSYTMLYATEPYGEGTTTIFSRANYLTFKTGFYF